MRYSFCTWLVLLLFVAAARPAPRRIGLERGRSSVEVTGRFTVKVAEKVFLVRGSIGQHMKVQIKPLSPNLITAGTVESPSGKSDGGPGGVIFDSDLTETGDYKIRVFERQERLAGRFLLRLDFSEVVAK